MKKVAIVYDWMDKWGGVERLLLTLHALYPDAEYYTAFRNVAKTTWADGLNIKTSYMQRLPGFVTGSRILSLPFFPTAFESFNFNGYDTVISVTSAFAKSVITRPDTKHICILLTPPRFLWSHVDEYVKSPGLRTLAAPLLTRLREYDYVAARRPDTILSISRLVAERCKKFYGLDSDVLYPPFDEKHWKSVKQKMGEKSGHADNYFLVVSRLEPYKRIDLAIRACNRLKTRLVVVGTGSLGRRLRSVAGPTVTFRENISDNELATLYTGAQALLMPQEEDFGYTAIEAQYFGCPVIAYARSGAAETIQHNVTGMLVLQQTVDSLQVAIEQFAPLAYNMRRNAAAKGQEVVAAFSVSRFATQLKRYVGH